MGILDAGSLDAAIATVQPTIVIHLAARADSNGKELATQFVVGPGPLPAHDIDFRPHTVYGESEVIREQMVLKANLACTWTIIRPTNIWGPGVPLRSTPGSSGRAFGA